MYANVVHLHILAYFLDRYADMPTLPDYLGVSRIQHQSPGLCFNLEFIQFSPKIPIFFD